jgi:hypothetical protein
VTTTLVRLGPPAVMLSGVLLVVKGLAIIVSVADPSLVPPATLLFALGMVGLYARLRGGGEPFGTVGVVLARAALAASAVNLIGLALSVPAPGDPNAPMLLKITYMVAFLGILVGLLALGIAALRARILPSPWQGMLLAVGVLWFPLQGIGFAISDGVGLVLGGFAWTFLGYVLWPQLGTQASQPSRVR